MRITQSPYIISLNSFCRYVYHISVYILIVVRAGCFCCSVISLTWYHKLSGGLGNHPKVAFVIISY